MRILFTLIVILGSFGVAHAQRKRIVGRPCEGCEAVFTGLPAIIGCDSIAFGYDREVPPLLKADPKLTGRLRLELAEVAAELLPIRINDVRLRRLGLMAPPPVSLVRRVQNVGASVRSGLARLSSRV